MQIDNNAMNFVFHITLFERQNIHSKNHIKYDLDYLFRIN